jgi:predicted PurR-regulated permease PerM
MRNYPTSFQERTLWNAATGVSILILGLLVVGLVWLVGKLFGFLQPVLIPVVVAGIVAYLLDPLVRRLQKWNFSRLKAVIIVYLMLLLGGALLVLAILPGVNQGRAMISQKFNTTTTGSDANAENESLSKQITSFLRQQQSEQRGNLIGWILTEVDDEGEVIEPTAIDKINSSAVNEDNTAPTPEGNATEPNANEANEEAKTPALMAEAKDSDSSAFFWQTRAGRIVYSYKGHIWQWTTLGTSKIFGILGFLLGLVMVPIYLFFFLKDSASIQQHWHDYVPLKASRFKSELVDTLQEINGYLISFFRGQVLVGFIDGILVGIALTFYGLPYGFLIGVFMAILGVIPYIGNILCLIPACFIAWFHAKGEAPFGLEAMPYTIGVVIIFVVVQQINSLVTAPKIVGDSVGLHPMTVIFSMIFWTVILGGFAGALLAVPLTAAIKVLFRRFIWEKKIKEAEAAEDAITDQELLT